ncbi:hypothetical protein A9Q84_11205 [Halobacteriovorax marinus]|uniref:Uncharacterized protein n=1 Tax=Halobacteriovorax marinus TaxID=97084 RepID=A0A1Y5F7K1_9BACT|nr:hypothetical protein A9Q84_11205 [Halobacteriovorax marinus]
MKKIAVLTGVTSGFGINWIEQISDIENYKIYVLARSQKKMDELLENSSLKNIEFIKCNLDSKVSIDNTIELLKEKVDRIDLLVNNAGLFLQEYTQNTDGIELMYFVNYLAPLLLTKGLSPLLVASGGARVVNTSSFQHLNVKKSQFTPATVNNFNALEVYRESKLFITMLTKQLANEYSDKLITVNCYDPGMVNTSMTKNVMDGYAVLRFLYPLLGKLIRTPAKGAETGVYLSTSSEIKNVTGHYFKDKKTKSFNKIVGNEIYNDLLIKRTNEVLSSLN